MQPAQLASFARVVAGIREQVPGLSFEILEIGAVPLGGAPEPFHRLLDDFPGSRIHAFELDPESCAQLQASARRGVEIHRAAIGARRETRTVHLTNHSMCTSLYRPDEGLMRQFHGLEVAYLRDTAQVETVSIDELAAEGRFGAIDFVKIDIQGAELDAFRGAVASLASAVAIVSEVEFAPIYENQPLFADVDRELRGQGFMLHKFVDIAGRALRPVVMNRDPFFASWHLWGDAMFVRELSRWSSLGTPSLAKLAVLALLYGSPDIAFRCLQACDERLGSRLVSAMTGR
jgi:FkbM family methyltransferase